MRFGLVHRVMTDALASLGVIALVVSGQFSRWVAVSILVGLAFAVLMRESWLRHPALRHLDTGALLIVLAVQVDNVADRKNKNRSASGIYHGSHTHPETRTYGDRNGTHLHPENLARGLRNGAYTHPEKVRKGELHGMAKLNPEQVLEIRNKRAVDKVPIKILAETYHVCIATIGHILSGRNWKHI